MEPADSDVEMFLRKWEDVVLPAFDRFEAAIDDAANPIPGSFFEVGYSIPSNPLLEFLDCKPLSLVLHDYGSLPEDCRRSVESAFIGYLERWRVVLDKIVRRTGVRAGAAEMDRCLRTYVGGIRAVASGQPMDVFFPRAFDEFSAICNAFRAIGDEVASAVPTQGPSPSDAQTPRRVRRGQDCYCMTADKLAELFGVDRKTIQRWKKGHGVWPELFRSQRSSLTGMRLLVPEYKAYKRNNNVLALRGRQAYNDDVNYAGRRADR